MPPTPPPRVLEIVGPLSEWDAVAATNPGLNRIWLTAEHAVKRVSPMERRLMLAEVSASAWLAPFMPTASPHEVVADDDALWVVGRRCPGVPLHRVDLIGDVTAAASAVGDTLARLHRLPVADVGDDVGCGWEALHADIASALAATLIDPSLLPDPYLRYDAARLVEIWAAGRPESDDDLVVCHGDPSLPNFLIDGGELSGVLDLGRLRVADRHLDLAIAQRSVHRNLGPEAVFVFYEAYGSDPDLVRLDHYLLASLLLP